MKKLKYLSIVTLLIVCGCAGIRDRSRINHNFLTVGMDANDFISEWGYPTKSISQVGGTNDWNISAGSFGRFGGFSMSKGRTYDVWNYDDRGCSLMFYNRHLAAWSWNSNAPITK
jgi:hypothetical protein